MKNTKMINVDLSRIHYKKYDQMYAWCNQYISDDDYKWHHQPSREKYWVDFINPAAASAFIFQWMS